jgi:transposase-like protein
MGGRKIVIFRLFLGGGGDTVVPYSEGFKSRMVKRLAAPNAPSATVLSREVGVPQPTLSAWLRQARTLPLMGKDTNGKAAEDPPRSPRSWTAEEKYQVVIEAALVPDQELGEFLRKKGLHAAQLEEWRELVAEAAKAALTSGKKSRHPKPSKEARRIRELEKDLRRKEKALAELTALLALKKKLELLWGDEGEGTDTKSGT